MASAAEIVYRLTEASLTSPERQRSLHDFAEATGWYPSDEMVEYPGTEQFANGHLLVEHGMANTAVISFLKPDSHFAVLGHASQVRLLELSYNNLVDWHLLPDSGGLTAIYNRTDPPRDFRVDDREAWRADAFAKISGRKVRPELRALDDAFISTVSYWKRVIGGEIKKGATNEHLSALFNVLIFVRAYEDHRRRLGSVNAERLLVNLIAMEPGLSVSDLCRKALSELGTSTFPPFIRDQVKLLDAFRPLESETIQQLVADFYKSRFSPYRYDFSLISKHALSRIYEHYVSILRSPESDQLQFFPGLAEEQPHKALGSYYTPQYIARFFARYLQEHIPPRDFRAMKIVDPACGSGIFLRTTLELQCDPVGPLATPDGVKKSFRNVLGLDIDASACEATRLSLSLLHLVLTDEFPDSLNILARDAVEYIQTEIGEHGMYGAVVANPPYIRWESQTEGWRIRASDYLGELRQGKADAYAVLLRVGLDLVRPGGYAMYVLPHTFLYAENTRKLRELISRDFWVRLVADLSDLKVFRDVSSYTILLILQRKNGSLTGSPATIVKCRSNVGEALSVALQGRVADNEFFRVFEAPQAVFSDRTWKLLPPRQQLLLDQLAGLPRLSELARVWQGIVTGFDDAFILARSDIPPKEKSVWRPLLSDREMIPYLMPRETRQMVFYPMDTTGPLDERELKTKYPGTWSHLKRHEKRLRSGRALAGRGAKWWYPLRLRDPDVLFSPKIVCPHLMLTPRFGLDLKGRFAITRSPFIVPRVKARSAGDDFLKYLVAVLNSAVGFWQIGVQSHKYSRQYAMVEIRTLGEFRLPDPCTIPARMMHKLIGLVDRRLDAGFSPELESAIDKLVAELYELSEDELRTRGII